MAHPEVRAQPPGEREWARRASTPGCAISEIMPERSVYAVIPNWNGWQRTVECLASIRRLDRPPDRVVIVDNGSTDDSVSRLRDADAELEIVQNDKNRGFAVACNQGIRLALEAGADHVWLLNNDTQVAPAALTEMVATADANPRAAAVGAVLYRTEDPERTQAWGGGTMSLWTGWARHATGPADPLRYLTGACLLLRRDALEGTGLFDERFFFFWEDTDLCYRLRRDGWELAVAERARVGHDESSSIGRSSEARARYFAAGLVRFLRKHAPVPLVPAILGLLHQLARAVRYRSRPSWRGTWRGWLEGWRGSVT